MENEHTSSSEISIDSSSNSECLHNLEEGCKLSSRDEHKENAKINLVLNLQNLPTEYELNLENDDSSEKLSAVMEQPEESSLAVVDSQSSQDYDDKEINCVLQERIESLRQIMADLREELSKEMALWRKEREEFKILRDRSDVLALEEATAAARAAAAAYAAEAPLSTDLGEVLDITSEETLRELTILEYEKKLAKYQDEYSFSQAERRYNTRWQLVAHAYKQKLIEVERLCNEELEKVRQNASYLQPLKEMASQWYANEGNHGDSAQELESDTPKRKHRTLNENVTNGYFNFRKIDTEMNVIPDIFSATFQYEDTSNQGRSYGQS